MRKDKLRADEGGLVQAQKTDEGYLHLDGFFTRVGVFPYRNQDGSIRRELRPREEVFDQKSLDSFKGKPITKFHPDQFLNPENVDRFQVGTSGQNPKPVESRGLVRTTATVHKDEGIKAVEEEGIRQYSGGYRTDIEFKSGTWRNPWTGQKKQFDAIQRNIRGNHIALVEKGRAGPECRVRFDGRMMRIKNADQVRHDVFSGPNDPGLPDHVKQMSKQKREQWVEIWNSVFQETGSEKQAFQAANGEVKGDSMIIEHNDSVNRLSGNEPIAPRGTDWDESEAREDLKRISGAERDNPNEQFDNGFLWVPDNDNLSDRKFPVKKEVNGELQIVPQAAFSAVSVLRGGRGNDPNIPEDDEQRIWEELKDLYARFRDKFDDFNKGLPDEIGEPVEVEDTMARFDGDALGALMSTYVEKQRSPSNTREDIVDDLSSDTGLTTSGVKAILNGESNCPTFDTVKSMARRLGISTDSVIAAAKLDGCRFDSKGANMGIDTEVTEHSDSSKGCQVKIGKKIYDHVDADLADALEDVFEELSNKEDKISELEQKVDSLQEQKGELEAAKDNLEKKKDELESKLDDADDDNRDDAGLEQEKIDYGHERIEIVDTAKALDIDVESIETKGNEEIKKEIAKQYMDADEDKLDLKGYVESSYEYARDDAKEKTPLDSAKKRIYGKKTDNATNDDKTDDTENSWVAAEREYEKKLRNS